MSVSQDRTDASAPADVAKAAGIKPADRLAVGYEPGAELIGIHQTTFRKMCSAGLTPLPAVIGRRKLFLVSDLVMWLENRHPDGTLMDRREFARFKAQARRRGTR